MYNFYLKIHNFCFKNFSGDFLRNPSEGFFRESSLVSCGCSFGKFLGNALGISRRNLPRNFWRDCRKKLYHFLQIQIQGIIRKYSRSYFGHSSKIYFDKSFTSSNGDFFGSFFFGEIFQNIFFLETLTDFLWFFFEDSSSSSFGSHYWCVIKNFCRIFIRESHTHSFENIFGDSTYSCFKNFFKVSFRYLSKKFLQDFPQNFGIFFFLQLFHWLFLQLFHREFWRSFIEIPPAFSRSF